MVVKVEEALACLQMNIPEAVVERKIRAIERLIRSETNNNFQDRAVRIGVPSCGGVLLVDELENRIHPVRMQLIVSKF